MEGNYRMCVSSAMVFLVIHLMEPAIARKVAEIPYIALPILIVIGIVKFFFIFMTGLHWFHHFWGFNKPTRTVTTVHRPPGRYR